MNKTKVPSLIAILVLTIVTSVMWIGFGVYRAITSKPAPVVPKEIVEPLDPTLEKGVIEKIQEKIYLSEGEIPETQISETASPSPTPAISPSPSPASAESPSPSPTPLPEEETI